MNELKRQVARQSREDFRKIWKHYGPAMAIKSLPGLIRANKWIMGWVSLTPEEKERLHKSEF